MGSTVRLIYWGTISGFQFLFHKDKITFHLSFNNAWARSFSFLFLNPFKPAECGSHMLKTTCFLQDCCWNDGSTALLFLHICARSEHAVRFCWTGLKLLNLIRLKSEVKSQMIHKFKKSIGSHSFRFKVENWLIHYLK